MNAISKQDEILINRAEDACRAAEYTVRATCFLTPRERTVVHDALVARGMAERMFWWGGFRGAERAAAVFLPEWLAPQDIPVQQPGFNGAFHDEREAAFAALLDNPAIGLAQDVPIEAVEVRGSGYATLSHRDFMGSVLALGVERETVGDIVVPNADEPCAVLFLARKITPYITENLTRIGRDAVRVSILPHDPQRVIQRRFRDVYVVVSSPRIDTAVRSLAGISREDAAEHIRRGDVERNYAVADAPDRILSPGDILSIRGTGKFRLANDMERTKKDRIRLHFAQYV